MTYNDLVQMASNAVNQSISAGRQFNINDTVCVIHSATNRFYTAFSNGEKHAEMDAVDQLMAANDTAIFGITLLNASSFSFIMPCSNCISSILGINPNNSNAVVVTPTEYIPFTQIGQQLYAGASPAGGGQPMHSMQYNSQAFAGQHSMQFNSQAFAGQHSMQFNSQAFAGQQSMQFNSQPTEVVSSDVNGDGYDAKYLKKKLSRLLEDDDDIEMAFEHEKEGRKRFNFFRK